MSTVTSSLGDALRLLGLPLDERIDATMLAGAYRDAARAAHPDSAPEDERARRTEQMRAINVARDAVREHLDRLVVEPYVALGPDYGAGSEPLGTWWEEMVDDPSALGVRWNPTARRVSWTSRFDAARRALCIAIGDTVTIAENGVLDLGRVVTFDSSVRTGLRTSIAGIPVEVRRVGVEVELEDGQTRIVDAAHVEAAGWRCPVCLRSSAHGELVTRPCPRCVRRFRRDYSRWRDLGARRRRLRRRIERLDAAPAPFAPRRYPRYREADDRLAAARERVASLEATRDALRAALREAEEAEQLATARAGRARSATGIERRERERRRYAAEAARAATALRGVEAAIDEQLGRIVELRATAETLERELRARHTAAETARERGADRRARDRAAAESELRGVELELAAVAPDAPSLLDAFDAWGQAPDRWLA